MARELNMDFNIVWGKLEEINTHIIGNMVINIQNEQKDTVCKYLENKQITWEILK